MAHPHIYRAENVLWASSVELVEFNPELTKPRQIEQVELVPADEAIDLFIAAVSTPDGKFPPYLDTELKVFEGGNVLKPTKSTDPTYVSDRLVILPNPRGNKWSMQCHSGAVPYTMCAAAFHNNSLSGSPGLPPKLRIRCRFCKTAAKALAMGIAAAATATVIPTALVTAVATFLGYSLVATAPGVVAGAAGAVAFITACFGDTVDVIAEKLCVQVGLCP